MTEYTKKERALIWISNALRHNLRKRTRLYDLFDPADLFDNFSSHTFELEKELGADIASLSSTRTDAFIDDIIERNDKLGVKLVTIESEAYPELLKNIVKPPLVLSCKGDLELLRMRKIGVVGTRDATNYGLDLTKDFVKAFAKAGLCVVSGIARGVDVTAHKTCLENNGKTIAVLPCGIDVIYPSENAETYKEVEEQGLLVTEYCLGSRVQKFTFNERNRIISGLAEGVFVPEMGEKSGSKITVNYALEQNRTVYAVPGNIYSKTSNGCNILLKELQGAMVLKPQDVLDDFHLSIEEQKKTEAVQFTYEQSVIINALEKGELHYEEIIAKTGLSAKVLTSELLKLEIDGFVESLPGNYYQIKNVQL